MCPSLFSYNGVVETLKKYCSKNGEMEKNIYDMTGLHFCAVLDNGSDSQNK